MVNNRDEGCTEEPNGDVSPRYQPPGKKRWITETNDIAICFIDFLDANKFPDDFRYIARDGDLAEISLRVDKRAAYYSYFHSIKINERKRYALQAYWINQFHPFTVEDDRYIGDDFCSLINEHFAAYLLMLGVYGCQPSTVDFDPNESAASKTLYERLKDGPYYKKLIYSIRYRNIPIDSFVLIAETLVPESFDQVFDGII